MNMCTLGQFRSVTASESMQVGSAIHVAVSSVTTVDWMVHRETGETWMNLIGRKINMENKTLKAFVINPTTRRITEVTLPNSDIEHMLKHMCCECFCMGTRIGNDIVYVDDEGLLNHEFPYFFKLGGRSSYQQPLAGIGLVMGSDLNTGESTDASITIETLYEIVRWYP